MRARERKKRDAGRRHYIGMIFSNTTKASERAIVKRCDSTPPRWSPPADRRQLLGAGAGTCSRPEHARPERHELGLVEVAVAVRVEHLDHVAGVGGVQAERVLQHGSDFVGAQHAVVVGVQLLETRRHLVVAVPHHHHKRRSSGHGIRRCPPGPILRNFSGCTISKVHVWCNALTLSKVTTS